MEKFWCSQRTDVKMFCNEENVPFFTSTQIPE